MSEHPPPPPLHNDFLEGWAGTCFGFVSKSSRTQNVLVLLSKTASPHTVELHLTYLPKSKTIFKDKLGGNTRVNCL